MAQALLTKKGGGYSTVKFENYEWNDIIELYPNITSSGSSRWFLAATTVGDYALFAGGWNSNTVTRVYSTVDAYDKSLTRSTPVALSQARANLAATTVGDYALFAGGDNPAQLNNKTYYSTVDAYDKSLTRSTPTALSRARANLTATTVGDYALFGGGVDSSSSLSPVDAYDTSLTQSTPTALSVARYNLAATTTGNYAFFAGGFGSSEARSTVDAYNSSLTRSTPKVLSVARYHIAATTVGDYALFGGGYIGTAHTSYSTVDAYDTSLTASVTYNLSQPKYYAGATTVNDRAFFLGGLYVSYNANNYVQVNTTRTLDVYTPSLEVSRWMIATRLDYPVGVAIGDYALFGMTNMALITKGFESHVYQNCKYKFQHMTNEATVTELHQRIGIPTPATGYIKFKNTTISNT